MKSIILILTSFFIYATSYSQLKVTHSGKSKEITVESAKLSIVVLSDGRYSFSYTNGLKGGLDFRSIIFKNKADAKSFVKEIGKAFSLKEGESNTINYSKYEIDLSIVREAVFMIVKVKGLSPSTLTISKETFDQVDIL